MGNMKKPKPKPPKDRTLVVLDAFRVELYRLRQAFELAFPPKAVYAALVIGSDFQDCNIGLIFSKGSRMSTTLQVGQTATAVLHEFAADNSEVSPIGPVTYQSSAPAVATVDPSSGLVTAVGPGTATITGTDAGNGLSASGDVTDTANQKAVSATLVITPNAP